MAFDRPDSSHIVASFKVFGCGCVEPDKPTQATLTDADIIRLLCALLYYLYETDHGLAWLKQIGLPHTEAALEALYEGADEICGPESCGHPHSGGHLRLVKTEEQADPNAPPGPLVKQSSDNPTAFFRNLGAGFCPYCGKKLTQIASSKKPRRGELVPTLDCKACNRQFSRPVHGGG